VPKVIVENGLGLYYEVEGQGDSVVLVQGLDRDHNGMMAQRKELSKHFQVIAYDARGTGQSDTPRGPYSCRQMADDLCSLLKALEIKRAHIIGASLGGTVAQEFAIHFPEMTFGLVLVCTFARPDYFLQSMGRFWIEAIEKMGHARLCEEIMHWTYTREFFDTQRQRIDSIRQKLDESEDTYNIKGFQWKAEAGINADTTDRLHKIKAPTLVIAGEVDYFIPPSLCEQQLVNKIKGSRFIVIKDAAHALFDEKSDEVNKEIRSFLLSIPG
jgi:pimeloyl-ACP methyl ester carboxylesterase